MPMNFYWRSLLVLGPLAFFLGAWWSFEGGQNLEKEANDYSGELKLLVLNAAIPEKVIQEFSKKYNIEVKVINYENDYDWQQTLYQGDQDYDVIIGYSWASEQLKGKYKVAAFAFKDLDHFNKLSPDFKNLELDPKNSFFLPFAWTVFAFKGNDSLSPEYALKEIIDDNDFLLPKSWTLTYSLIERFEPTVERWIKTENTAALQKSTEHFLRNVEFKNTSQFATDPLKLVPHVQSPSDTLKGLWIPQSGTELWLSVASLSHRANNLESARMFFDYLLSKSAAQLIKKASNQALTTLWFDKNKKVPDKFKARFIRQIPLSKVHLRTSTLAFNPSFIEVLQKRAPKLALFEK